VRWRNIAALGHIGLSVAVNNFVREATGSGVLKYFAFRLNARGVSDLPGIQTSVDAPRIRSTDATAPVEDLLYRGSTIVHLMLSPDLEPCHIRLGRKVRTTYALPREREMDTAGPYQTVLRGVNCYVVKAGSSFETRIRSYGSTGPRIPRTCIPD
jgi:hypothetical protein